MIDAMQKGINLNIEASLDYRIGQIKKDYLHSNETELLAALDRLKSYLNEARVEGYKEQVRQQDFDAVIADLLVKYYDPRYNFNKKEFSAYLPERRRRSNGRSHSGMDEAEER